LIIINSIDEARGFKCEAQASIIITWLLMVVTRLKLQYLKVKPHFFSFLLVMMSLDLQILRLDPQLLLLHYYL